MIERMSFCRKPSMNRSPRHKRGGVIKFCPPLYEQHTMQLFNGKFFLFIVMVRRRPSPRKLQYYYWNSPIHWGLL